MVNRYRVPKSVVLESSSEVCQLAELVQNNLSLSLRDVVKMSATWQGVEGRDWASKITNQVLSLTESLLEENRVAEIVMDGVVPEQVADESVGVNPVADLIMSADAAMIAVKTLLAGYEENDPAFSQAYNLTCAADAVLSKVMESLGITESDDDDDEEENSEVMSMDEPRSSDAELQERKSAMASAERITFDTEVRALTTDDGVLKIGGYAAQFNKEATGLNFREMIAPGAFTRSLDSNEPVFLLINHDTDQLPLASTQSGTLVLTQDETGLRMDATLDPSNPRAAELASALTRGDVDKMSFAFTVAPGGDTRKDGLRTLTDLNLFEVSVVTWPAYDSSSVGLRKADDSDDLEFRKRLIELKFKLDSL